MFYNLYRYFTVSFLPLLYCSKTTDSDDCLTLVLLGKLQGYCWHHHLLQLIEEAFSCHLTTQKSSGLLPARNDTFLNTSGETKNELTNL